MVMMYTVQECDLHCGGKNNLLITYLYSGGTWLWCIQFISVIYAVKKRIIRTSMQTICLSSNSYICICLTAYNNIGMMYIYQSLGNVVYTKKEFPTAIRV